MNTKILGVKVVWWIVGGVAASLAITAFRSGGAAAGQTAGPGIGDAAVIVGIAGGAALIIYAVNKGAAA